jgi:hypothetical protein
MFNYLGHVWYDRFKSFILWSLGQFIRTFLYIAENPVMAGLVKSPEQFEYNGVRFIKRGMFGIIEPPDLVLQLALPAYSINTLQWTTF